MNATTYQESADDGKVPTPRHISVMPEDSLKLLSCYAGGVYVDGTVGMGGHSAAILAAIQPGGILVGIDRDQESLALAESRLSVWSGNFRPVHDNYKNLSQVLRRLGISAVDGILLDLGISSWQMLAAERGFSFQADTPLDMRMDRTQARTAADIINETPERELADLIYRYGEDRRSRRIAAAIVRERLRAPITRCAQLADIIRRATPTRGPERIHPATRTFQALRIAVNEELDGLEDFFLEAFNCLKTGGRLVVIAFHSLEDRLVKRAFRRLGGQCVCDAPPELCRCNREVKGKILTGRPLTPGDEELAANPRARSARLRAIEKI